jgi:hypothetical protein
MIAITTNNSIRVKPLGLLLAAWVFIKTVLIVKKNNNGGKSMKIPCSK